MGEWTIFARQKRRVLISEWDKCLALHGIFNQFWISLIFSELSRRKGEKIFRRKLWVRRHFLQDKKEGRIFLSHS